MSISEAQRATLRVFCDTVVPSIDRDHDPHGLWARSASDLGVPEMAENVLLGMPSEVREGLLGLLDGLAAGGFSQQSQASRELTLKLTGLAYGVPAQAGVGGLTSLVLFLAYGAPNELGQNPNWAAMGYPGPLSAPPQVEKPITPVIPEGDALDLEVDVAIVGSGSGGGVIAGVLAQAGLKVAVLEAGPYFNESDFPMLEIPAFQQTYWRGGPQTSADLNFTLMAGSALGGGSLINWTNCLRTTDVVRKEWAAAGLTDVATPAFDTHLDAVADRMSVNGDCSDLNPFFERLGDAADRLGWHTQIAQRNVDKSKYTPETAGYTGFGDQTGSKQSTTVTYLQDAYDEGAAIIVDTTVDRVLVEDGRAAGVVGTWTDRATGRTAAVTVRAPRVVVAGGSLESPALLLRSGIGGPAVGQNLRLHPATAAVAIYDTDVKSWWGAPHTLLVDHFEREMDYGFRLEGADYMPGVFGQAISFSSAEQHKSVIEGVGTGGVYIMRIRDHGSGQVVVDEAGQAQVLYPVTDEKDVATFRKGLDSLVRLLVESGAREVLPFGNVPTWRRGDDLADYLDRIGRVPIAFGGISLFTAHQMGSCRMGSDPTTSVADPQGQLHDTPGVWIGDASGFPTASGTNPMMSVWALAHRTAGFIVADATASAPVAAATH